MCTCLWLKSECIVVPLKNCTPKSFSIANFRHPVSKSWLRPCIGQPQVYLDMRLPSTTSSPLGNHNSTMVWGWPQAPVHHWATTGLPWCVINLDHQFTIGKPQVYHDVRLPSNTSSPIGQQRVYHDVWLSSTISSPLGNHGSTMMCD